MRIDPFSASSSKRKREDEPSSSGQEPGGSRSAPARSRQGMPPADPVLKRADSLPARLPSQALQRAEVPSVRHPITRPLLDVKPPVHFTTDGDILAGSVKKLQALEGGLDYYSYTGSIIERNAEFTDIIKSRHPNFENYSREGKAKAAHAMLSAHPKYLAMLARIRNMVQAIPNRATSIRPMDALEQQFLTRAFRHLQTRFQSHPYRIHGETAVMGDRLGKLVGDKYAPKGAVASKFHKDIKYHLHTHPPFLEPFTSSASGADHKIAAKRYGYENNKVKAYVTNGKDVLFIPPDSMELVKLTPDPGIEKKLGKFPVAFTVPDPQRPPRPFSNHEAPAAFKEGWAPPAGWKPPEDGPGSRPVEPRGARRVQEGLAASRGMDASRRLPEG
jgi:hypothetical protein